MEAVVLLEYDAGTEGVRAALMERVGSLALAGQGRLDFVATERDGQGQPLREVVAVGFARSASVRPTLERWRAEGALPPTAIVRCLGVEPIWSMQPLALMFP